MTDARNTSTTHTPAINQVSGGVAFVCDRQGVN
jgi:hypothetical protein